MSEPSENEVLAGKMLSLRNAYLARLPSSLAHIDDAIDAVLATPADGARVNALHRLLHTMAGSAGTLGPAEFGSRARVIDIELDEALRDRPTGPERIVAAALAARALLTWCKQAQCDWQSSAPPAPVAADAADAPAASQDRPILVVDDDVLLSQSIAVQIAHLGYRTVIVNELSELAPAVSEHAPAAILMDMGFGMDGLAGAKEIAKLKEQTKRHFSTIFISSSSHYDSRLAAVRAGADSYFPKPVDIGALSDRLDVLTARKEAAPYRILIVEADTTIAEYYATILRSNAMEVELLKQPGSILGVLRDFQPDLVLIDIDLPDCNGFELTRLIRQDNKYLEMPIIFLPGNVNDRQGHAGQFSADGALEQAMPVPILLSFIASHVERHRAVCSLIARDSLTRLYNHSAIKEQIDRELARSRRSGAPLSVAMIDIDYFKKVNDTYGHPVGDLVIRTLARMLQQRLRCSDIVGRYGGEEFVVVFPNTPAHLAAAVLDKIRLSFQALGHETERGSFSSSFSAGISEAKEQQDTEELLKQADELLYLAKHAGRNRIATGAPQGT